MHKKMRLMLLTMIAPLAMLTGCADEGPAEKAGAKVDEAVENVKDAIDPAGPAEKAGEKIDEVVEKATGSN